MPPPEAKAFRSEPGEGHKLDLSQDGEAGDDMSEPAAWYVQINPDPVFEEGWQEGPTTPGREGTGGQ